MTTLVRHESEFLLYAAQDGAVKVRVLFRDETAWPTQRALAELFGVQPPAIAKHLKNNFDSKELEERSVVSILETTGSDGKTYRTSFYNLDAIIAVGYRVNSYQATQFRIWATRTLREFMIKGFVLDDERLNQGRTAFGTDYFDDLLERIREIRASERRFYQKVADIYALSADYDPHSPLTRGFFANVQNKLHWRCIASARTQNTSRTSIGSLKKPSDSKVAEPPNGHDRSPRRRPGRQHLARRSADQPTDPHGKRNPEQLHAAASRAGRGIASEPGLH